MAYTIDDGGLVVQDPTDEAVYNFDWSDRFAAGVTLIASEFTITVLSGTAGLAADESALTGLTTQVRLSGGVRGSLYQVANKVTTDETPAQVIERSFQVLAEDL